MVETHDIGNSIYIKSGTITDQEIPTIVSTGSVHGADHEFHTLFTTNTLSSGMLDVPDGVDYGSTLGSSKDILLEFVRYDAQQYSSDVYVDSTTVSSVSEAHDVVGFYTTNDLYTLTNSTLDEFDYSLADSGFYDVEHEFSIPGAINKLFDRTEVYFRVVIGPLDAERDSVVTIDLSNVNYFRLPSSAYCADVADKLSIVVDTLQATGRVDFIKNDLFITSQVNSVLNCDAILAGVLKSNLTSDLEVTSGSLRIINSDIFNAAINTQAIGTDIKTRSLFVVGFFIQDGEFVNADSQGYIDLVDFLYPIVDNSISITIDGIEQELVDIDSVDNTKRVYFDPNNDFYSPGEIVVNVYAESSIGEVLDEDFILLYGYNIVPSTAMYFKPNSTVVVRGQASNEAFCPNKESLAFYFKTVDYDSFNLKMSIFPTKPVDISMSIYPQSTTFFYGNTYTVTISGIKDFSGNELEPFDYSFTIENPAK